MMGRPARRKSALLTVLLGGTVLAVVVGIVQSPGEAFRASLSGMEVWWRTVFPGLLPPLILAELLAATGMLHGLATLAEPLTRKLFRLPGAAGWAIAFGWSAGIPAGAKETARLREQGLIRAGDVDTLLLVSHMPNPFFVVVIVGGGFLHAPELGWAIAAGLWASGIAAGIVWARLTRASRPKVPQLPVTESRALIRRAFRAAADARREDGRPLGKQLADAVTNAVGVLLTVGALMMMSSVVLSVMRGALPNADLWIAVPGLYEMHLGAYASGRSPLLSAQPVLAAALLAAALAWSGWSGLLQARALLGTGKPPFPWAKVIAGRLLHAALALLATLPLAEAALSEPLRGALSGLLPGGRAAAEALAGGYADPAALGWAQLPEAWAAGLFSFGVFLALALLASLIRPRRRDGDDDGDGQT